MSNDQELLVFMVAGEVSGDRLGGPLMAALKERTGGRIRFAGVGGPEMTAQGLDSLFPIEMTAIMGFGGIVSRVPAYLERIRKTATAAVAAKPDIVVIIDSPDFTHRVAKRVRAIAPDIPIIDYVSPSVWAWRPWRAKAMRRYIDHVLALLPFEPDAMKRLGGPPCSFVGHPIGERASLLRPSTPDQWRRTGKPHTVLLMPGSRKGELQRMLGIFERAAVRIAEADPAVELVMPAVSAHADRLTRQVATWPVPVRVVAAQAEKDAAFRSARAALVKSGTGTLELAVAGIPMIVAYRVGHVEGLLAYPFINVSSIILANLVLGENVIPQFVQYNATPAKLAAATLDIIRDGPARQRQLDAFKRLDDIMQIGRARPSERAADVVLAEIRKRG
jgi:lipid-A-disaccharide synthase